MVNPLIITIDATPPNEILTAQSFARVIKIFENNKGTTAGFTVSRIATGDTPGQFPAGDFVKFYPPNGHATFYPGQVFAYVSAVSGAIDIVQLEDAE